MKSGTSSAGLVSVVGSSPGIAFLRIAVRVGPGLIEFTRIGVFSVSAAQVFIIASSAALVTE